MLLGLTIALIALALDQVSKYVMLTSVLEEQHAIVVGAYFNLEYRGQFFHV